MSCDLQATTATTTDKRQWRGQRKPTHCSQCFQPKQKTNQLSCYPFGPWKQMDLRLSQCLSGGSTQQMVVRLTLLLIIMIAWAADDNCACRGGYKLEEPCTSASVRTNTWVSWQPSKEGSRSSDIPVAGPGPAGDLPNQREQRGEGVRELQNSMRRKRSGRMWGIWCNVSHCLRSAHNLRCRKICPTWRKLKESRKTESRAADWGICYLAFDKVTVDNRVDACECGRVWLPQLIVMRWQLDKLWLWWLHQLPGPTSRSVFPDWLFLSDATHDGKSLPSWFLLGRIT